MKFKFDIFLASYFRISSFSSSLLLPLRFLLITSSLIFQFKKRKKFEKEMMRRNGREKEVRNFETFSFPLSQVCVFESSYAQNSYRMFNWNSCFLLFHSFSPLSFFFLFFISHSPSFLSFIFCLVLICDGMTLLKNSSSWDHCERKLIWKKEVEKR